MEDVPLSEPKPKPEAAQPEAAKRAPPPSGVTPGEPDAEVDRTKCAHPGCEHRVCIALLSLLTFGRRKPRKTCGSTGCRRNKYYCEGHRSGYLLDDEHTVVTKVCDECRDAAFAARAAQRGFARVNLRLNCDNALLREANDRLTEAALKFNSDRLCAAALKEEMHREERRKSDEACSRELKALREALLAEHKRFAKAEAELLQSVEALERDAAQTAHSQKKNRNTLQEFLRRQQAGARGGERPPSSDRPGVNGESREASRGVPPYC